MSFPDGPKLNPEYDISPIEHKRLQERVRELESKSIDPNDCTIEKGCDHHNLNCGYPKCTKGMADRKKALEGPVKLSMLTELEVKQERELEWLRFFYRGVSYALGPADADIYYMIKEDYVKHGGILPKGYELEEEEDE